MAEQIDALLLIEELKAQRNMFVDKLAEAGALIVALRKEKTVLEAKVAELEKPA